MLSARTVVYAAVELLGYASVSLTLETARSRNLASASFYLLSKLAIQLVNETDGKFRVLENSKLDLIRCRSTFTDTVVRVCSLPIRRPAIFAAAVCSSGTSGKALLL